MQDYSLDLRSRVLAMADAGHGTRAVARLLKVSESWVRRVKQRRREHGELGPRRRGGANNVKLDRERLGELVAQQPDATLAELRERLAITCSLSAICTALKELRLSYKKSHCTQRNRIGLTSLNAGHSGASAKGDSTRGNWCSSTRHGRKPT